MTLARGLGPVDEESPQPIKPPAPRLHPDERDLYGPKPRTYGPVIRRPAATSTASAPMYGPKIVRNES